jgi:hypothetical protein
MLRLTQYITIFLTAAYAYPAWSQGINSGPKLTPRMLAAEPNGWLISPAEVLEFRGEEGFNERPALRPRGVAPVIEIIQPQPGPDLKVKAPFAITVQFIRQADAPIDPGSFKVLYGAFKLDITNRITKFVKVTREGFSLENAQIPLGKHRLTLQVQDEKLRMAERELRLEVE